MLCELYPASQSGLWPVLVSPHSLLSPDHQSVSPSRVLSILESDINGITQHVAGLGLPPLTCYNALQAHSCCRVHGQLILLRLSRIPLCECTTFCFSFPQLLDVGWFYILAVVKSANYEASISLKFCLQFF